MTEMSPLTELALRWEEFYEQGQDKSPAELCRDCPDLIPDLALRIAELKEANWIKDCNQGGDEAIKCRSHLNGKRMLGRVRNPSLHAGAQPIKGYYLIEQLGEGGYGEVWSAQSPGGQRKYALKFVYGQTGSPELDQGGSSELKALNTLRSLHHPSIIIRHRIVLGDTLMVIMELAECTLGQYFEGRRKLHPVQELCANALYLLRDVAEALDYLQSRGLVHHDVKPANLLMVKGQCKIGDFGTMRKLFTNVYPQPHITLSYPSITVRKPLPKGYPQRPISVSLPSNPESNGPTTGHCRLVNDIAWDDALQKGATICTNTAAFTDSYAPPEAFEGKSTRTFDQYSLALSFCQLVFGQNPFPLGTRTQHSAAKRSGNLTLGFVPAYMRPIIQRALSVEPQDRFWSCMEFVTALRDALLSQPDLCPKAVQWLNRWPTPKEATENVPILRAKPRIVADFGPITRKLAVWWHSFVRNICAVASAVCSIRPFGFPSRRPRKYRRANGAARQTALAGVIWNDRGSHVWRKISAMSLESIARFVILAPLLVLPALTLARVMERCRPLTLISQAVGISNGDKQSPAPQQTTHSDQERAE